jgi:hypothetical protein
VFKLLRYVSSAELYQVLPLNETEKRKKIRLEILGKKLPAKMLAFDWVNPK